MRAEQSAACAEECSPHTDDFCVIDIEQVYKFGEFERIQAMDVMEITTTLLNMRS